jgi:hypothetical protein
MELPPLNKGTEAAVEVQPQILLDAGYAAVVLMKQTYLLGAHGTVRRSIPGVVRPIDVPWDAEAKDSSPRYPCDVGLGKPSTDVVVVGRAYTPDQTPAREVDVAIRVGSLRRRLRVYGPRVWYRSALGLGLSAPEPFLVLDLKWEDAWGGKDFSDPKHALEEPRNPLGRGVACHPKSLIHMPGPRIEDPDDPIRGHPKRHTPAGFACIPTYYEPRRGYAGTLDDRWAEERMPLRPLDFDPRHNQVAAPSMITPEPLRGGEDVELTNLTERGFLAFKLPRIAFYVGAKIDGTYVEQRPMLDTVLIEAHNGSLEMTWRSVIRWPRPHRRLSSIRVYEKAFV